MFGGLCRERNIYRSLSLEISHLHTHELGPEPSDVVRLATLGGRE
jgi:hypothetical protein